MVQEAEELRIKTIHELCIAAMEYGNPDYEQLLSWAKALLQDADNAYCKKNNNAAKSYLFFYHNLWEYAKHHLSIQEYRQFCGKQIDYWKQLHHD